ncbi:MAG: hypothetical protein U5K84_10520 [Alkalibacterium sp.]|nr:hypothetical protein [Alkalibacterium sp.]
MFIRSSGRYYIFLIHSLPEKWMRAQACFVSDTVDGEYRGGDILIDDRGMTGQGVAQGGIVDTPQGDWYAVLFQDSGAVGRLPVLVPVEWKDHFPHIGENKQIPETFFVRHEKMAYDYQPLVDSDTFNGTYDTPYQLKPCWQFNHEPDIRHFNYDVKNGYVELTSSGDLFQSD